MALKKARTMVTVDEMQFGFRPKRGTTNAVSILRRLQEERHARGKTLYMCFVDQDKAFDRVPKKVLALVASNKGIPEVLVNSVMSLHEGAKTRARVD